MKTCAKCKVEKPIDNFGFKSRSKDGYNGVCKSCKRIQDRESKIRTDRNNRVREDRKKNPEKYRKYGRDYYYRNREACIERSMKKYHKQPNNPL